MIDPIPENLLSRPLDYLSASHFRLELLCRFLASHEPMDSISVQSCILVLKSDLPLNIADEEDSLYPLLVTRCSADDNVPLLRARAVEEHQTYKLVATELAAVRDRRARDREIALRNLLAKELRNHMTWEQEMTFTLARKSFDEADLAQLSREFARRRSLPLSY